jgi:hypothetical protein
MARTFVLLNGDLLVMGDDAYYSILSDIEPAQGETGHARLSRESLRHDAFRSILENTDRVGGAPVYRTGDVEKARAGLHRYFSEHAAAAIESLVRALMGHKP